jgi:hypothetical protein
VQARLLANQHDFRVGAAVAEHGLRGGFPQRAGAAIARLAPQRGEAAVRDFGDRLGKQHCRG